ncbi:Non-homologous end joining protein Ku [bioreactor metagenome]|uniref:Non-homologous end joining protein Ku n=1 Tax=bioreactor metagenome TaxID=1076179 RepID=A0A644TH65_9ZZZZ|nr:Ku protein [Negativicutes bacterium]
MPRPIWSGSISFGLVNIPIKLYTAIKRKTLQFHQLRRDDGCRIRLKRVCSADNKEVLNADIVKGYEISPDHYVVVSSDELEALYPKASRSIDIEDFVLLEQIDPIFFEQSYYIVPDKGSSKAYSLLLEAMRQSQKVAIAKMVLRNKQHLTTVRPNGRSLTLSTMHFADEIVSQDQLEDLPADDIKPEKRELAIALQLVESLSTAFTPTKYHDEYRDKVLEMIEKKADGQELISQHQATNQGAKVIDLMAALEASVSALKKKPPKPAKPRRKKASAQ